VYYGKANLSPLFEKIGLRTYLLTRGKYAAIDTAARPLTLDERAKLRREIELFYRGFVQRVADARKKPYEQVEPLAQGRVWLGAQAVQNGLVDEIGGIDRAVELIRERAKIPASDKVTLVTYPQRRRLLDILLEQSRTESNLAAAVDRVVGRVPWRSLAKGGVLRLMPYTIDVR
jgi:protease-4